MVMTVRVSEGMVICEGGSMQKANVGMGLKAIATVTVVVVVLAMG